MQASTRTRLRQYSVIFLLTFLSIGYVYAETAVVKNAEILWLRATDSSSNTCLVEIDLEITTSASESVDCEGSTVAMKCGGTTDGVPSRTFDLAMFAFENRREISIEVDDSQKLGELCHVHRIWVTRRLANCDYEYDNDDDEYEYDDDCDAYRDSESRDSEDCEGDDCPDRDDD